MSDREFEKGNKHEAFSQMKGASSFQFSLREEVLPPTNLESSCTFSAIGNRWETWYHFKELVSYKYSCAEMASNKNKYVT